MDRSDRTEPSHYVAWAGVLVLLAVAVGATVYSIFDPTKSFVHPTYLDSIVPRAVSTGSWIQWMDLANSILQFGPEESRPRVLAILVDLWDIKLRLLLHRFFLIPPTFIPIAWFAHVIVAPILLYKLMRNLGGDRIAAIVASAVFLTTTGFQSGLTMLFIPGKSLVTVALLVAMYALSTISRTGPAARFSDAPRATKWIAVIAVLFGLFLDEVGIFAFVLLPIMFWPLYWNNAAPTFGQKLDWRGIAICSIPAVVFLVSVLVLIPVFYRSFFNSSFDYLGNVLVYGVGSLGAKSVFVGPHGTFGWPIIWQNFTNFFGLTVVPVQVSPFSNQVPDDINLIQVSNLPQSLGIAAFFGIAILCSATRSTAAVWLRRTLLATLVFVVLMTLLSIRHNPIIVGFYYGASISLFIALLVGLMAAAIGQNGGAWRIIAVALPAIVMMVQLNNFEAVNHRWRFLHNELALRGANEKQIRLLPKGTEVGRQELATIRSAWKDGKLESFLKDNAISAGAIYLVYELRAADRLRPRSAN